MINCCSVIALAYAPVSPWLGAQQAIGCFAEATRSQRRQRHDYDADLAFGISLRFVVSLSAAFDYSSLWTS